MSPALVFIGFMGSGKSRAARRAEAAGLETTDTDQVLERELGMSIGEFFDREGEPAFREREEAMVVDLLEKAQGGAIALGGGSILSPRVRGALGRHVVAWLDVPVELAWERVESKSHRPLATDRDAFERRFAERAVLYAELADARVVWAESQSGEYPVFVGRGILGRTLWPVQGRPFLVTDHEVAALYADPVTKEGVIELEPGEHSKNLGEVERVLRELIDLGATRHDHLLGLGGGVVGDVAGLCAALYQRGVPIVQLPTTLLAQVDSAYGGKTGVDLPEAKNYVGAYHLPAAVIADTATLATLPSEELGAGFVEVTKTALLAGGELWDRVRAIETIDPESLDDVIFACARYKTDVVAADERDAGSRAMLNLGHTVGHAIEAASEYQRYRHGEAVGLGLLAALRLSDADGLRDEVAAVLERHGLPIHLDPSIDIGRVLLALGRDKKRTTEGVGFVLLARPGKPLIGQRVDEERLSAAVEELR